MLALAFQVLLTRVRDDALSHALATELAQGTRGMIAGQVFDTLGGEGAGTLPLEAVRNVLKKKTGALIRAAVRMGAMCALGAPDRSQDATTMTALTRYGEAVGLMFQIADDLLDVEQSREHAGKRTGKDHASGKLTYPAVLGVEGSRSKLTRQRGDAIESIASLGAAADSLRDLADMMARRTS